MEPFRYHVYACTQEKPGGKPCCNARGAQATLDALSAELGKAGLADEVHVTACGSLGLCERGPNWVVYPEGVWYVGVKPEDVPEIVREHFVEGRPVARLFAGEPAALKAEILENKRKALAAMAAAQQPVGLGLKR
jgi:(2Fe-2S) ferredoxin